MKFNIGALLKIHLPILLAFFIISLFYFLPELQNKELGQGDVLSWKASASEAIEYNKHMLSQRCGLIICFQECPCTKQRAR